MSDRGDTTRDVLLRVRAENLSTASFTQISAAVKALTADLNAQITAANKAAISERELSAQIIKLEQAARGLTGLATAIDRFRNFDNILKTAQADVDRTRDKLTGFRAELEKNNDTSAKAERQLGQLVKGYERAEATLNSQRQAYADLHTRLTQAGIDTGNLAAAEANLKQTATDTGQALTRLNQAKLDYATNSRLAREAAAAEGAERRRLADAAKVEAAAIELTRAARQKEAAELRGTLSGMMAANREAVAAERAKFEAMQASVQKFGEDSRAASRKRLADGAAAARLAVAEQRAEIQKRTADMRAFYDAQIAQLQKFNEDTRQLHRKRANDAANAAVAAMRAGMNPALAQTTPGAAGGGVGGAAAQVGAFGLRPSAVGNLAYQVNDVISGLAMGQNVGQIFAQQIGQIAQLFPRFQSLLIGALRLLPLVAAAAVAVGLAIGGINRVFREMASSREFTAALTLNADGATRNVAVLNRLRKEIRDLGVDWKDAGEIIRFGIGAGLTDDALARFAKAARDVADVTGEKVPDAMRNLIDSFTKGFAAVQKLNEAQRFLTAEQYTNIRTLFEQGKGAEANARAFDIYQKKISDAQKDAVSPFTDSMRRLSTTWDNFLVSVGNSTFIQTLVDGLIGLLRYIDRTVAGIDNLIDKAKSVKPLTDQQKAAIQPLQDAADAVDQGFLVSGAKALYNWATRATPPAATGVVPPAIPGSSSELYSRGPGVKIDDDSLRKLESLIVAGAQKANLPAGYRVVSISGSRPGATVAGTGEISEHARNQAIDVKIVDAQGRDVPGSMGLGGPLYRQLDASIEALAREQGRTIAVGTRFGKPDAGHYSESGQEAVRQATREGRANTELTQKAAELTQKATEKTKTDLSDADKLIKDIRDKDATANEAAQRRLDLETARLEAQSKGWSDEAVNRYANAFADQQALQRQREREAQKRQDQIRGVQAGADEERIRQVGLDARLAAEKAGVQNITELRRLQTDAEALERAKIQQAEKEASEVRTLQNQLASLARQNELKNTTDISARVKAVNDQYVALLANLAKLQKDFPNNTQISILRDQATKEQGEATERATAAGHLAKLNALQADRNALISTYNTLVEKGVVTQGEAEEKIRAAYARTGPAIAAATEEARKFSAEAKNIDPTQLDLFNAKIKEIEANARYISPLMKSIKEAVENSFATGIPQAFDKIAEAIGGLIAKTKSWKDVIESVKQATISFFTQLLKDIAMAILKYEGLKLASSLGIGGGGGGSGIGGIISSLFGGSSASATAAVATPAVVLHRGGVAGHVAATRALPASFWQNAPRYHNGTSSVGAPGDVPSLLRVGEEVLTEDNPRHIRNWAGGGNGPVNIRNVLVMDESQISGAMAGSHGEEVVVAHLVRNAATIRAIVKG